MTGPISLATIGLLSSVSIHIGLSAESTITLWPKSLRGKTVGRSVLSLARGLGLDIISMFTNNLQSLFLSNE